MKPIVREVKSDVRMREVSAKLTRGEEMPGFVESVEKAGTESRAGAR